MSTTTTNYGLVKPALTDAPDITAMNPNWDTIDTKLKERMIIGNDYRPNILINGDFKVWQRGTSFYRPNGYYTADRWVVSCSVNDACAVTPLSLNLGLAIHEVQNGYAGSFTDLTQIIENYEDYRGKTVTLSSSVASVSAGVSADIYVTDGVGTSHVGTFATAGIKSFSHAVSASASYLKVIIRMYRDTAPYDATLQINWIKLEQNDHATPFIPRLYNEELIMCKRYYQKMGKGLPGYSSDTTSNLFGFLAQFPVSMRVAPTVSFLKSSFQVRLYYSEFCYVTLSSITDMWANVTAQGFSPVLFIANNNSWGLPYFRENMALWGDEDDIIAFDAEL